MNKLKLVIIVYSAALIIGLLIGAVFFYKSDKVVISDNYNYFFVDSGVIEGITTSATSCLNNNKNQTFSGGIVNHHLLASNLIYKLFCQMASRKVERVIVLSPNHFGLGANRVIVGAKDWRTASGVVLTDQKAIKVLADDGVVLIDDGVFIREHGVGNLVPIVKEFFPRAKIIPIVIKEKISEDQQVRLLDSIKKIVDDNTVVIASLDFSHDLTLQEAQIKDQETLPILENLDYSSINKLNASGAASHVDSPSVLSVFLRLMVDEQTTEFKLLDHSNSALISNQSELASTTSYFVAVYKRKK